jgi:nitrite reductase/ring-hydroxylating ferredoxin subunit
MSRSCFASAATSVLLARDAEGKVRSFANACRHRGVRVADGGGTAKRFTCPFHAWTYNLDGSLFKVPVAEAFDGMCFARKGLVDGEDFWVAGTDRARSSYRAVRDGRVRAQRARSAAPAPRIRRRSSQLN